MSNFLSPQSKNIFFNLAQSHFAGEWTQTNSQKGNKRIIKQESGFSVTGWYITFAIFVPGATFSRIETLINKNNCNGSPWNGKLQLKRYYYLPVFLLRKNRNVIIDIKYVDNHISCGSLFVRSSLSSNNLQLSFFTLLNDKNDRYNNIYVHTMSHKKGKKSY